MKFEEKLSVIIAYWDAERNRLMELIGDCIKEQEYQLAHFHYEALIRVNQRLQTFNNINDSLYDHKHSRQESIKRFRKYLENEFSEELKIHWTNEIARQETELSRLNQLSRQNPSHTNATFLEETLINLVNRKIRGFNLILNKSENFVLNFTYKKQTLIIKLPHIKQHFKKWLIGAEEINLFYHLGFQMQAGERSLVLVLANNRAVLVHDAMLILCKIVFEMFYFKVFENETYLEILPKRK